MNKCTLSPLISVRSILMLSSHLRTDLTTCLFSSDFRTNMLYAFLLSIIHVTRLSAPFYLIGSQWSFLILSLSDGRWGRLRAQLSQEALQFSPLLDDFGPKETNVGRNFARSFENDSLMPEYSPRHHVLDTCNQVCRWQPKFVPVRCE